MLADLLIKNGYVITVDASRRIIRDGAVVVEGDKIVEVGKTSDLKKKFTVDIEIDAAKKIVMPGLINCHVHLAQGLLRGVEDKFSLIPWLRDRVMPLQNIHDKKSMRISTLLACLEMIKTGTTCFAECLIHTRYGFENIVKTIEDVGIRAVLAKAIMSEKAPRYAEEEKVIPEAMVESRKASVKEVIRMIRKFRGKRDRIQVWFGPRPAGACDPDLYREVGVLARKNNVGVHLHLAASKRDLSYFEKEFGKSPVEFARDVGLVGPNVLFIHLIWLVRKDIQILADTKTNVCHCPSSNMKLGLGFAKVPEMLKAGVNVGIGCDGAPSNDSYDMIREMKLAACIHRGRLLDPTIMLVEQVIEMATINGARALGWGTEIGSLEAGKKADIILLDLKRPHMVPYRNIPSNLVYAGMGSDVDTVIIDGKIIMDKCEVKTIDEASVINEAVMLAEKIDEKAGILIKPRWKEY